MIVTCIIMVDSRGDFLSSNEVGWGAPNLALTPSPGDMWVDSGMVAPDGWATLGALRILYAGGAVPPSNVFLFLSGPREPRKVTKPNS